MIGECAVRSRQFDPGHVASHAIPLRNFARRSCFVARLALRIVGRCRGLDRPVRIVTGDATDAAVVCVVALAAGQTIWLKPYIQNAARTVRRDIVPGTVALTAEIGHRAGGKNGQFPHP